MWMFYGTVRKICENDFNNGCTIQIFLSRREE